MKDKTRGGVYRVVVAASAIVIVLIAAGCTEDPLPQPSGTTTAPPSASPTATPTPTLSQQDQDIAAAKAAYENYRAVHAAVSQAGMADWETKILPLVGGTYLDTISNYFTQAREQGLRQTGESTLSAITTTEYVADPTGSGHEQVKFDACIDTTGVDVVDPAGKSVIQPGFPPRLITAVTMQHQNGRWTVDASKTAQDRPC